MRALRLICKYVVKLDATQANIYWKSDIRYAAGSMAFFCETEIPCCKREVTSLHDQIIGFLGVCVPTSVLDALIVTKISTKWDENFWIFEATTSKCNPINGNERNQSRTNA